MIRQQLDNLQVIHHARDEAGHGLSADLVDQLSAQGLFIDTCLRQLLITRRDTQIDAHIDAHAGDVYQGDEAYSFLLQTVTGLNSSVPGETNIAGQFRCAWRRWSKSAAANQQWLINPVMQQLFVDNKHVRAAHLQNIGGSSYGSLLRKLLQPVAQQRVLFIGAGRFAQSMLPFFDDHETALWNRRLHPGIDTAAAGRIFAPDQADAAAAWADVLVLTTPADLQHDAGWLELTGRNSISTVAHLGLRRAEPGQWQQLAGETGLHTLDDIFDLREQQSALRRLRVMRARHACEKLAHAQAAGESFPLAGLPVEA